MVTVPEQGDDHITRRRLVTGREFFKALVAAGVINGTVRVHRVVIDAPVNSAVIVHVEQYGDERILHVAKTLDGVEISQVSAP